MRALRSGTDHSSRRPPTTSNVNIDYDSGKESYLSVVEQIRAQREEALVDRISRVDPLSELTFSAFIWQASDRVEVRCIVDHGCGLGYLLISAAMRPLVVTLFFPRNS